jgi:hypothetical protein
LKERRSSGVLIVEAIIAAFLMVFAFAASASLYDASLRWESQSGNLRKAALLAERKMEEIRALCSQVPSGTTFAAHADAVIGAAHPAYPDAPGFDFTVQTLPNRHQPVLTSGFTPDDGVHSPCSTLFTRPDNPGTVDRTVPAYAIDGNTPFDRAGDFQKNNAYETYPYSRAMNNSFRLVRVTVNFGTNGGRTIDLVSLIGDPILPPAKPASNINVTANVVLVNGSSSLTTAGSFAEYELRVTTAGGSQVEDVSALWSVHPLSNGTVDIFCLNAAGTRVRVTRNNLSRPGTSAVLFPKIRYEGIEARATSGSINL